VCYLSSLWTGRQTSQWQREIISFCFRQTFCSLGTSPYNNLLVPLLICWWTFRFPVWGLFFLLAALGLELRDYTSSHSNSPFFVMGFSRQGLTNYFPRLTLNHCSPDLCPLSS
jgi:hypothetical protein